VHYTDYSAPDFVSLFLQRTLRDVYYQYYYGLPLKWIHSRIFSAAALPIIGLTKITRMEFLPLDWIYIPF